MQPWVVIKCCKRAQIPSLLPQGQSAYTKVTQPCNEGRPGPPLALLLGLHRVHGIFMGCTGSSWGTWESLGLCGIHGIFIGCTGSSRGTWGPCIPMEHVGVPESPWGAWALHGAHGVGAQPGAVRSPRAVAHPSPIQMCGAAGQHLVGPWL